MPSDIGDNLSQNGFATLPYAAPVQYDTPLGAVRRRPFVIDEISRNVDEGLDSLEADFRCRLVAFFRTRRVHSDVADCVQETFKRVLAKSGAGFPIRNLSAFVMTTAKFVAYEACRAQNDPRKNTCALELIADWHDGTDLEAGILRSQRLPILREALTRLTRMDRTIVIRTVMKEHDRQTVCDELGISRNVLALRLHRALKRLAHEAAALKSES